MNPGRTLAQVRAPDEDGAQARAWPVLRATYREREAVSRRNLPRRVAAGVIPAILVGVLALSPAGATVRRAITQAFSPPHATPAPFALPAQGDVLVSGAAGAWTVAVDGRRHRLGAWRQASWSPHGLYIAVTDGRELAVLDPRGQVQWQLAGRAISDPTWAPPSGYRVAYLSGDELRVVAGDGSGDHPLASAVAPVAPAWRPDELHFQLAYVTVTGRLVVRDADGGQLIWSRQIGRPVRTLTWSPDGRELLVLTARSAEVLTPSGARTAAIELPVDLPATAGSLSPDGGTVALVLADTEIEMVDLRAHRPALTQKFRGAGLSRLTWSPDGRWLLAGWPAADQWVFIRVGGGGVPRLRAVAHVSSHFASTGSPLSFPTVDGWCCTALRSPG